MSMGKPCDANYKALLVTFHFLHPLLPAGFDKQLPTWMWGPSFPEE